MLLQDLQKAWLVKIRRTLPAPEFERLMLALDGNENFRMTPLEIDVFSKDECLEPLMAITSGKPENIRAVFDFLEAFESGSIGDFKDNGREEGGDFSGVAEASLKHLQGPLLNDSNTILVGCAHLRATCGKDEFQTSEVTALLKECGIEIKNPAAVISSMAKKEDPEIEITGRVGGRRELKFRVVEETAQKLADYFKKF